ncbi:MAG: long-chain fatty acid--CoA ligase [Proteobacteria bacterium]|nr:long-chain fatty acid--CoA ligase [Pseudomonadota bacterium]
MPMDYKSIRNLPTMFFDQAERFGDRPLLWHKQDDEWWSRSWTQTAEEVTALARGLLALGVQPGDRIGLVSENRPEWLIADIAIMAVGAFSVPAYITSSADDYHYLWCNCGSKGVIVSTPALARKVLPAAQKCPDTEFAVCIEAPADPPIQGIRTLTWADCVAGGAGRDDDIRALAATLERATTSCLIYTSGTGGQPKGVMLSHGAILSNCMGAEDVISHLPGYASPGEIFLSFLPLSHSYEHTGGQFFPLSIGAEIYYAESLEKLVGNIAEVRPTIMMAVPRLYEMIHGRIMRGLESQSGLKRALFHKAVELGRKKYEKPGSLTFTERLLDGLLDRLVRAKVAGRFGGRLKAFVSGGAPMNYDVGIFFTALGLRLLQGYGQTESAPVISINRYEINKIDTVGPLVKDVEVRIAQDGEILARGELLMNGYWNNPQATAETIVDGWLHTGDIGEFDEDNCLKITDRKKDIIVNSGGDNISPQRIEGMLTVEPEVGQAMVYGDARPHLVALIVPDEDFAKAWGKGHERATDLAALIGDADFVKAIGEAVDRVNAKLTAPERVRRYVLAPEGFTTDNEMLTPSMKIRRHVIKENYGEALDALYGG